MQFEGIVVNADPCAKVAWISAPGFSRHVFARFDTVSNARPKVLDVNDCVVFDVRRMGIDAHATEVRISTGKAERVALATDYARRSNFNKPAAEFFESPLRDRAGHRQSRGGRRRSSGR